MYCDSDKDCKHITGTDHYPRSSSWWLVRYFHYLSFYRHSEFKQQHCQWTAEQSQWCISRCCERCERRSSPQDEQYERAVHGHVSERTVRRPEGLRQWWQQLQFFPGMTFGCIKSDCLCADTTDSADGLFNVGRMWQWPHLQQRRQQVGAVPFTWKQTATSCWTMAGRRLQPLPTTTRRPPIPALPTLTQPVTQTPCLGTYPTPKYTNNFISRVYTTLVGRFNCVFHPICGIRL